MQGVITHPMHSSSHNGCLLSGQGIRAFANSHMMMDVGYIVRPSTAHTSIHPIVARPRRQLQGYEHGYAAYAVAGTLGFYGAFAGLLPAAAYDAHEVR